jgi:hypothetical protein
VLPKQIGGKGKELDIPEDARAPLWLRTEGRRLRKLRISFGELSAVVAEEEERPV